MDAATTNTYYVDVSTYLAQYLYHDYALCYTNAMPNIWVSIYQLFAYHGDLNLNHAIFYPASVALRDFMTFAAGPATLAFHLLQAPLAIRSHTGCRLYIANRAA